MSARTKFAIIAAAAVVAVCVGCGKHDSDEKYFLITVNKQLPYWQTARAGFDAQAKSMKVFAEYDGPDSYDPQAEKQAFQRAVSAKATGILVSPANPELLKSDIDAAVAQGIPVITIDSDAPSSKRLIFVGTNNYEAGTMGGEMMAKALKGKGTVIVFTMPGQANLDQRLQGYRNVFDRFPGIKITRVVDMKGDPRVVFDTTQAIVDKKEALDGFICLEAQGGQEVAAVLDQNHVEGKVIVAMDTDGDTLNWIRKGRIIATIAQKPYTMAYYGLKTLDDLHHGPKSVITTDWTQNTVAPIPAYIDTGLMLVDKNNVEVFAAAQNAAAPQKK